MLKDVGAITTNTAVFYFLAAVAASPAAEDGINADDPVMVTNTIPKFLLYGVYASLLLVLDIQYCRMNYIYPVCYIDTCNIMSLSDIISM